MSRLSLVGCAAILLLLAYRGLTLDSAPEDFQSSVRPSGDTKADGTIEVQRGDLEETVVATGTIEPLARVEVRSEVSGIVRAVLAEEGDRVARGQPIVELNGERLAEVVAERRAALARVRAYARVDVVGRAAVAEADARRRAARVERLARDGLVTAVELEGARREVRVAGISLRDAEAEQAARAAAVAQTEEGLRRAESDLARAVIRSPIDGVVLHRPVEVGTGVADLTSMGGTLAAVVADDRRMRLVAEVDEADVARVRIGEDVEVSVDALPDEKIHGVVRKVASSGRVERKISRFEIEIETAPDPRLRLGMSAEGRIVVGRRQQVLLVPNAALLSAEDGGDPSVRLVDPTSSRARLVRVEALYSDGFQTAIGEGAGIREGARIALRAR